MLPFLIESYQRHRTVKVAVRVLVTIHHLLTPKKRAQRRPCPLAGKCSKTGLAEARTFGWTALPGILTRMSLCGPSLNRRWPDDYSYSTYVIPGLTGPDCVPKRITSDNDCRKIEPCSYAGLDNCEWWIRS